MLFIQKSRDKVLKIVKKNHTTGLGILKPRFFATKARKHEGSLSAFPGFCAYFVPLWLIVCKQPCSVEGKN